MCTLKFVLLKCESVKRSLSKKIFKNFNNTISAKNIILDNRPPTLQLPPLPWEEGLLVVSFTSVNRRRPFAAIHSSGAKPPCCRARNALAQARQKAYIINMIFFFVCLVLVPMHLLLSTMTVLYRMSN